MNQDNNTQDVALEIHIKLREEIERISYQLSAERAAHAQVRDKNEDLRYRLKAEQIASQQLERRKEAENREVREVYHALLEESAHLEFQRAMLAGAVAAMAIVIAMPMAMYLTGGAPSTSEWVGTLTLSAMLGIAVGGGCLMQD